MEQAEIEKILHDELERARLLYDAEEKNFRAVTRAMIPTEQSPGHAAIRAAGAERRSALQAYALALQRFMDFIIHCVVPDDLKW